MKTLSAGLAAAWQRGGEPYLRVVVDDRPAHGLRFAWTTVYDSGSDPGLGHAAAVSPVGTLHRARFVAGSSGLDLQTQRLTDPTVAAAWSTWTTRLSAVASLHADCTLCARADGSLWLLWGEQVGGAPALRALVSTDDGQTWGTPLSVLAWPSGIIAHVAAAENPAGAVLGVACLVDGGSGFGLRLALRTGSGWSDWPDPAGSPAGTVPTGVALAWSAGTTAAVVVASDGPDGPRLFARQAAGATGAAAPVWSGSGDSLRRPPGATPWYHRPRLVALGADFPGYYLTHVETDGTTARLMGTFARRADWFVGAYHLATVAAPGGPAGGAYLLRRADGWWLVTYGGGRRSAAWTGGAGDLVEIPPERVVALEEVERWDTPRPSDPARGGRLTLTLDNADGALGGAGSEGDMYRPLRAGSRLALGLGYHLTGGAESVWGVPWVVERVEWADGAGVGHLTVHAVGAWEALRATPIADDRPLGGVTLAWLVDRALWRLCDVDSAALEPRLAAYTTPSAALRSGESLAELLEAALAAAGLWLRFATAPAAAAPTAFACWAGAGFVRWEAATPSAGYHRAGSAEGPIRAAVWERAAPAVNRLRVLGRHPLASAVAADAPWAARTARDGWRAVRHALVADAGWAADLAGWELARLRSTLAGWLDSNPHPGLELFDVVSVTDRRAGLAATPCRVVGRRTRFDRRRAIWEQRLWLSGA